MLRERSIKHAREERRQRVALVICVFAAVLLVGFCSVAGFQMLTPPAKVLAAGRVEDYTDNQPRRYGVPKLTISSMITRRDPNASEDVIFVRRDAEQGWIALLGVDTLSGCFLYWDPQTALYQDINCLGSRYTPDGRYLDGLKSGEQPRDMARLAVEIRDGQVVVRDELARVR